MQTIALFHSVLGVRRGVLDAAERLRREGCKVLIVDQYDGRVFDDYTAADEFAQSIGFPELMRRALDGVRGLPDGFLVVGFSNGGGMAEYVALHRRITGAVLVSAALPLAMIGGDVWPSHVPAQIHYAARDPFRDQAGIDALTAEITSAKATVDFHEYDADGHLFMDSSLPEEYDGAATALLWERVSTFCADRRE